jgi:hypothetical protein
MVKAVIAVLLIVLSGGTWLYLDYQNKLELKAAQEMRRAIAEARAEALARAQAAAQARANFEALILADLNTCKATAEKAKEDFLIQNQKPIRHKRGQFGVTQAIMDQATSTFDAATAACQATYNTRLQNGS